MKVTDTEVQLSEKLKIIKVVIDKMLTFDNELCRSGNYHIRTLH